VDIRELYHGTNGDNILKIIREGALRPTVGGKLYFSERRFDSVLMHGADRKRQAAFAVKLRVSIPTNAALLRTTTAGVADTLVVTTSMSLHAQVLELYVRGPGASTVETIRGVPDITKYLSD
jgi:hypothetical protein